MSDDRDKNGFVRWVQLIPLLLALSSIVMGLLWKTFDEHAKNPHPDAVTVREYGAIREQLAEIKSELRWIRERIHNTKPAGTSLGTGFGGPMGDLSVGRGWWFDWDTGALDEAPGWRWLGGHRPQERRARYLYSW